MSTNALVGLCILGLVTLWLGAISSVVQRLSRQERQALRRRRIPCSWEKVEGFKEGVENEKRLAPR